LAKNIALSWKNIPVEGSMGLQAPSDLGDKVNFLPEKKNKVHNGRI